MLMPSLPPVPPLKPAMMRPRAGQRNSGPARIGHHGGGGGRGSRRRSGCRCGRQARGRRRIHLRGDLLGLGDRRRWRRLRGGQLGGLGGDGRRLGGFRGRSGGLGLRLGGLAVGGELLRGGGLRGGRHLGDFRLLGSRHLGIGVGRRGLGGELAGRGVGLGLLGRGDLLGRLRLAGLGEFLGVGRLLRGGELVGRGLVGGALGRHDALRFGVALGQRGRLLDPEGQRGGLAGRRGRLLLGFGPGDFRLGGLGPGDMRRHGLHGGDPLLGLDRLGADRRRLGDAGGARHRTPRRCRSGSTMVVPGRTSPAACSPLVLQQHVLRHAVALGQHGGRVAGSDLHGRAALGPSSRRRTRP